MIFKNFVSRQTYEINTRAQGNTKGEEYMRTTLKNLLNDIDLIVNGKPLPTNS